MNDPLPRAPGRALLPMADEPPAERRDAARNRAALLEAAACLVARSGADAVTMDAVAARAGVGKGTVFRRFESREGLMAALLDRSERSWQAAVISGPPPLGPGAPALDRLVAFGRSRLETTLAHADLIRAADRAGPRPLAARSFARLHVQHLLGELGVRGDLPLLATALLAPLEILVLEQEVHVERMSVDRVVAGWQDLLARIVSGPGPGPGPA